MSSCQSTLSLIYGHKSSVARSGGLERLLPAGSSSRNLFMMLATMSGSDAISFASCERCEHEVRGYESAATLG